MDGALLVDVETINPVKRVIVTMTVDEAMSVIHALREYAANHSATLLNEWAELINDELKRRPVEEPF
jgi:hypothetical protein